MKAWKIVAAVVALIVIGVVIFIATFDIARYKGVIQDQAKAATGREVTIGDIRMAFSLTPTVVLENVSVANAPWGSRPQMATVKKVEAQAELMPLLSGQVNISEVNVEGADILLETNKQGTGNWEFDTKGQKPDAATGQQNALNVGAFKGSDLKLTMKDGKTGALTEGTVGSVSAEIEGALQEMRITDVELANARLTRRDGQMAIEAAIGRVDMEATGKITDLGIRELTVADVKVTGKTEGGPLNAEISKLTLNDQGALDLQAKYNGGDIRANGTVAALTAMKSGQKALPAKLNIEGMGLKGDVDVLVDATRTPPFAKGAVNIPEVDMAKFAPAQGGEKPAAKPAQSGPMFSDEPLPWDTLTKADADVKVTIGTVRLTSGQTLTNVVMPIRLEKGRLALNNASVDFAGGQVQGDITANAGSKAVSVKGGLKGMTAEAVAKAYKVTDLITQGPLDLAVDVQGTGASPKAIAATLDGSVIGGMGESRIRNDALNIIGADIIMQVLSAVNPMGNKDPYTVARCAAVNLQIKDGVAATNNGIAMVTDKMQLVATGNINLPQERLDMIVKPTATGGLGVGLGKLVSAVRVTGPIAKPNIGVDAQGAAKALGGLAAAFATGGASLLAQGAADKAQAAGGGDVCAAARTWHTKR